MAQAKYLDAAQDLRVLQGVGTFASLSNSSMGSEKFAKAIFDGYQLNSLKRARQILDVELDMDSGDTEEPVEFTLNCGKQAREWLLSQEPKEEEPKHTMVTADEKAALAQGAESAEKESEEEAELQKDIEGFLGKSLPTDPNMRLLVWKELEVLQKKLKAVEMAMRKQMTGEFFIKPKEGTNTHEMGKGWKLKLKHTINRKADEAMFETVFGEGGELGEGFEKEDYFKFKPELIKSKYNTLSKDQRTIFDQCLIIKDGSPALEIVPPKEKK